MSETKPDARPATLRELRKVRWSLDVAAIVALTSIERMQNIDGVTPVKLILWLSIIDAAATCIALWFPVWWEKHIGGAS